MEFQQPCVCESKTLDKIMLCILAATVVLLSCATLFLWMHHQRTKRKFHGKSNKKLDTNIGSNNYLFTSMNVNFPMHYEIPKDDIKIQEIIGSGQFGNVFKGTLSKCVEVAVKVRNSEDDTEQLKSIIFELKMICYIGRHPNVVSFMGAYTQEISTGKLYIVTEYCENGSVESYLRKSQNLQYCNVHVSSVDLYQLYGFASEIATGMEYITERKVIHGDLATRNVLLTCEYTCKIADFGLSRRLYELNEIRKTASDPMPWRWMALEALKNREFTTKSDVWSYGVTLWEIFSLGMVPFAGKSWTEEFVTELEKGMRMGKPQLASDDIHQKMLACWNPNQMRRPTFLEMRNFFVELRKREYINL